MKPVDPSSPTRTISDSFTILLASESSYDGVAKPPIEDSEQ